MQRKFEVEIDSDSGPIDFVGYADIEDVVDGLHDTKTAAKSPVTGAEHSSMQMTAYATMKKVVDGVIPPKLWIETVVDSGKSDPKKVVRSTTRTMADLSHYLDRARNGAQLIRSGNFHPTDPSNWWCSQRWCGFFQICPYAHRPVASAIGDATGGAEPRPREE